MHHKFVRAFFYAALAALILSATAYVRSQLTLPAYDNLRIQHWLRGDAWTVLAESFLRDPRQLETLAMTSPEGLVIAYRYIPFPDDPTDEEAAAYDHRLRDDHEIKLSDEDVSTFYEMLTQAQIGILDRRADGSVYSSWVTRGSVERFDREFSIAVYYNMSPGPDKCNKQYRTQETGSCGIKLDDNWSIYYFWRLPYRYLLARCAGVDRALAAEAETRDAADTWLAQSKRRISLAREKLGQIEADQLAAAGEDKFLATRESDDILMTERLIDECDW